MLLSLTAPNHSTSCPEGKRILGGRQAWAITSHKPLQLSLSKAVSEQHSVSLRVVAAVDHRSNQLLTISCQGQTIGSAKIYCATAGAVYTCDLAAENISAMKQYGIELHIANDEDPLFIVATSKELPEIGPHLFCSDDTARPLTHFFDKVCSLASLQPCDWMETCVLDGIRDLRDIGLTAQANAALTAHLETFYQVDNNFIYEDLRGHPNDNQACGEENGGHAAIAATEIKEHHGIDLACRFFREHWNESMQAIGDRQIAAETAYSIAYPMMALADNAHYQTQGFTEKALQQLRCCRDKLVADGHLWLRYNLNSGKRMFPSWSRGVAWYLLGMVRTLILLPADERPEDLIAEIERCATWTLEFQLANGLWPCFLREADITPDTSGSAGIAAAIALAIKHTMISGSAYSIAAARAHQGLITKLTPDGWLTGVAPSNKAEYVHLDIQRMDYRIIGPWGMGLMAQLHAAVIGKVLTTPTS